MFGADMLVSRTQELLGTVIEIKLPKKHASLFSLCFAELSRIERTYSRFLDASELSALNKHLGQWRQVSSEFLFLLQKAQEYHEKTKGHFDITLKGTLDRLGYDATYSFRERNRGRMSAVFDLIKGYFSFLHRPIVLDRVNTRVLLRQEIELGGFGKGFALDRVASLLDKKKVSHYYINAGGDIYAKQGRGEDPWMILLEHPDDPMRAIGKVILKKGAIASSSSNRRRWGKHHHLINAKTGMSSSGVKTIFVLADKGIDADAYATALFTAGFEEGILLSKRIGVEILMISQENKMYQSEGFDAFFF